MPIRFLLIPLLTVLFLVFYLSWVPSPRLGILAYIPKEIALWADTPANENMRTAVPMGLLGLLAGFGLTTRQPRKYVWLLTWFFLVVIVLVAELGQLTLPLRHFDWGDVSWGAFGSLGGLIAVATFAFILRKLRKLIHKVYT